ncbi:sensor histidine kinase [Paractinoplanes hotanensis]|uniref:Oxygen sensor histidine kinase NreB n=1 Tax=Paractinoplanes hotanensis TaxID=2906497 RepID=A0ABT0YG51_9ACTN|nr:sensor histidine kinase [Actinoplanes hotanensis]MCM4084735.1 sensor histidine kinase [Actinoplanes hotanensis]
MAEELRREHRWNQAWALLPYGLLVLSYGISLFTGGAEWPQQLVTLAVAAGFAVWHWWFVLAHPDWWERRPWAMAVYFAGVLGWTYLLLERDEAFQLFVPACYVLAFVALPGWYAYLGLLAANLPLLVASEAGLTSVLINVGIITPLAALFGTMIRVMEREAIRRREVNSELVAMAAENTRLSRQAGVAEERARLAREIHDTVAQGLTGIVTQLEALGEVRPEQERRLDNARTLARTSLDEVRRSIDALRPGPLQDARLGDAVRLAVATWSGQQEVPASFTVTGTPVPAHSEVEVTLLRAAQEALANVGRHARAGRADVTLSYMEDVIVLDVRDDGTGFDVSRAGGFGLVALRQRVEALAGSVAIESSPGAGTAVSVTLPAIGPA